MSDDSPSGQTTTINNTDPWSGQQPYLETGFKKAEEQLDNPLEYYPNSTVVPFSNQTKEALNRYETRAMNGSPLTAAGQDQIQATLNGDFMEGNPYLSQMIDTASQPVIDNYQKAVSPGIDAAFSSSGRYGSGMHASAHDTAQQDLGRSLSDMAGSIGYQNYGDERNRMLQSAGIAPQMAAADYSDMSQLANVGQAYESQAGAEMQDDISRFNFGQQAEKDALAQYMALVGGGSYGGSSTATQPIYSNTTGDILGGAALATGIAGSLFGGGGLFPGALSFGG